MLELYIDAMLCVFVLFAIKNKEKLDSYTIGSRQVLAAWLVSGHDSLQRHECTLFDSYPATFSVYRHVQVSHGTAFGNQNRELYVV